MRDLSEWAQAALADPATVVLDTETTGLEDDARIVEVSVLTAAGEVLLDTLVNPGVPIPAEASAIHGITDQDVVTAPSFAEILVQLTAALDGRRCLIYNSGYDTGRLRHELTLHYVDRHSQGAAETAAVTGVLLTDVQASIQEAAAESTTAWMAGMRFEDTMRPYSDWVGEWSEYHGSYAWQALHGGHRALGDCRAVVECLKSMAGVLTAV